MLDFKENKGQSIVEIALILPVILLILFGIIQFGIIFNADLIITNASREGAREAAVGVSDTEIVNTIKASMATLDEEFVNITISPSSSSRVTGAQVSVQIDYNIQIVMPIISNIIPNPFKISAKTVMRVE